MMNPQHNRRTLSSAAAGLPPIHLPSSPDTDRHQQPPDPPARPPPVPNPSSFDDSSAALTVIVVLSALFFLGFFSLYIRRFARGSSSATTSTTTVIFTRPIIYSSFQQAAKHKGLDPATIRSMPSFAYGGATKYQMECSVCLSEFEEGDTVKVIPQCDHLFHAQCIDRWLCSHESCPVCRATNWLPDVRGQHCSSSTSDINTGEIET